MSNPVIIKGIEELNKKLRQLESKGKSITKDALTKAASTVRDRAQSVAPVDTGRLKTSIIFQIKKLEARIGTNVEYGPYQEFGVPDRNIPGRHYLFKGYMMSLGTILRIFTNALKGLK